MLNRYRSGSGFGILVIGIVLVSLSLAASLMAQERSLEGSRSLERLRPEGELRIWSFTFEAKDIGRLVSRVEGKEMINGEEALIIFDSLHVELGKLGSGGLIHNWGRHYVSSAGRYLGTEMTIAVDSTVEELNLRMNPDQSQLSGYFTRQGQRVERSFQVDPDIFGWDMHLLDQLELWLATQSFAVGDTLNDTLFSPQSLSNVPIRGVVDKFMYRQLYQGRFDSVFVLELDLPQPLQLSFTADKRLLRVDFKPQRIRAYLDYIGNPRPEAKTQMGGLAPADNDRGFVELVGPIGRLLLLALIAVGSVALVGRRGLKSISSWGAIFVGGLGAALALAMLSPAQTSLLAALFPNPEQTSTPIFLIWLLPAGMMALVQELVKSGLLLAGFKWLKPGGSLAATLGAGLGAGFGLVSSGYESVQIAGPGWFGWSMLGLIFMLLFHTVAGSLIGRAVSKGPRRLVRMLALTVLISLALRYLPVLAIGGLIDHQLVQLGIALITTIVLLATLIAYKNERA